MEGGDADKKLTFTEQAARRTECRRLQRFVKLSDYLIGTTLQMLVIQTVQDLLKLTFKGCTDGDVVVDSTGSGTVMLNDIGLVISPETLAQNDAAEDGLALKVTSGVQVGGVVVGPEVGTDTLARCGFDVFSDILCRLIMQAVPQIQLQEIIEEEGPILDEEADDFGTLQTPKAKLKEETHGSKWNKAETIENKKFIPLFRTELLVNEEEGKKFYFSPSLNEYLGTMDALLKIYLSTVEKILPLTNSIPFLDPANLAGGAYSAIRGLEDPEFGEGPHVGSIIIETAYFREICGRIRGVFVGIFSNATHWMNSLENLRGMWIENDSFDAIESLRLDAGEIAYLLASSTDALENGTAGLLLEDKARKDNELIAQGITPPETPNNILELGKTIEIDEEGVQYSPIVKFFEESLKRFTFQKQTMTAIPIRSIINNIMIDTSFLKSVLEPSPDRCFNNVAKLLPGIARDKNELLLTEVQKWVRVLNTPPSTVEGFVEYLGWLDRGKMVFDLSSFQYGNC